MLTLTQHTTKSLSHPFPTLEAMLAEPLPRTPQDMMQLEQRLSIAAAQTTDQILLVQLTRAHEDEAFVKHAIAQARAPCAVPLVHKGLRTTSVVLLGGTRLILDPLSAPGPAQTARTAPRYAGRLRGRVLPGVGGPGHRGACQPCDPP